MNPELSRLAEKANNLPLLPGVYIMLDENGDIIYIGKAKKLKNRVSSYFHGEHLPKVQAMADKVRDFNVVVVNSEFEALMLENSLIKQHKPHYNILLKDDKGYPFVRLDRRQEYPRFSIVSKPAGDGAEYFGPYGSRGTTKQLINSLSHALQLPDCTRKLPADIGKARPCLNYHMGVCSGWCADGCDREEYKQRIGQAADVLNGKSEELLAELEGKMLAASDELRFEYAATLRDRIKAVKALANKQSVINTQFADTDAVAFCRGAICCFSILRFYEGSLVEKELLVTDEPIEDDAEALEELIRCHYMAEHARIPKVILTQCEIDGAEDLERLLSEHKGRKVSIECPKRGDRLKLVQTAVMNSQQEILRRTTRDARQLKTLEQLQKLLALENYPQRIESFDISNLGDTGIVAAMVVFCNGKPLKRDYRKFRIKDMPIRDDYASMYQAVYRRFRNYKENNEKFSELPDLLLIDGGDTHAATAERALAELGVSVPVFGMVKDDRHRTRALINSAGEETGIAGNQAVFSMIGTIQEETHRFAIEYQRSLRYESYGSSLDGVPGIGPKRKAELIGKFKTVKAIKAASYEELKEVVPATTAKAVYDHYRAAGAEEKE